MPLIFHRFPFSCWSLGYTSRICAKNEPAVTVVVVPVTIWIDVVPNLYVPTVLVITKPMIVGVPKNEPVKIR